MFDEREIQVKMTIREYNYMIHIYESYKEAFEKCTHLWDGEGLSRNEYIKFDITEKTEDKYILRFLAKKWIKDNWKKFSTDLNYLENEDINFIIDLEE